MKSISRLKDEARKFEQREEWEKAIQAYLQVLKIADDEETEIELPLYNRLGDLCVRLGRPEEAVRHYEQAADRYAEAGLYNNAIALCNKALRYNHDRLELIRKLGQFSAQQGFITDARRYFLDYAERQFNAGRVDEALTALEDFADVSDDAEVRELLGRRMLAHGRAAGAVNALQRAYAMRVQAGETEKAQALKAELEAMDAAADADVASAEPSRAPSPSVGELPQLETDFEVASFDDPGTAQVEGLEPAEPESVVDAGSFEITGFEPPAGPADADIAQSPEIEGLETGAVDFDSVEPQADDLGLVREETSFGHDMFPEQDPPSSGESFDLPLLDDEPEEEATPAATPQIDHAPIDLGADFSFDLGGFAAGGGEPAATEPTDADFDVGAGADDDGIALPALEGDDDIELPTLAGADDDGISLDDTGTFDLPTLGDDAELPTLDAGDEASDAIELPTFDEETGVDAEPATWEPEPGPDLDVPTFEPEPSAWDSSAQDTAALDLPELEEPAAEAPPETDLPTLEEPAAAETEMVGESAVDIPPIELPTWDTEPAPPEEPSVAAAGPPAVEPAGTDWLDEVDAEPSPTTASPDDDWFDTLTGETATAEEIAEPEPLPEAEPATAAVEDVPAVQKRSSDAARDQAAKASIPPSDGFIDLGALITEDDEEETTRFRIQETAPTGDEDRDFAELLSQFKTKVNEHLPPEDASAHYDLGLAFKEMGLVDEAIGEFQVALRAGKMRLRVHEELGQCFLMKEQYNIAEKVLKRALDLKYDDELELLGVYYHLGRAYEALGRRDQARDAYERVLGMDINFEDVTTRLARLLQPRAAAVTCGHS